MPSSYPGFPGTVPGTAGNVATSDGANWQSLPPAVEPSLYNGRLSLSSTLAVPIADITGATTLYFLPYNGNRVSLYTGTTWTRFSIASLASLSLSGLAIGVYDVYLDYNAGSPILGLSAIWTNTTTRATALITQDGVYCVGVNTRRYLGTVYIHATGTTQDTVQYRQVWNYANRVERKLLRIDQTAQWSYNVVSWRQANAVPANQLGVVVGVAEEPVRVEVRASITVSTPASSAISVNIGKGNTTPVGEYASGAFFAGATQLSGYAGASLSDYLLGYMNYLWLEKAGSTNTAYVNSGVAGYDSVSSIYGTVRG